MDVAGVLSTLSQKYPGKTIIKNCETNPTEILCEIDPTINHPHYDTAIAVIDKSIPHIHNKMVETYKVLKGELALRVGNNSIRLREGESYKILPNIVHWGEGNETWVECFSEPGWTFEDHIIAKTRDVAVVIFFDKKDNIAIQRRGSYSKTGEKYGLWGGIKEANESPLQAMKRELTEELGFIPKELRFWKNFTYVVDVEGSWKDWVINHDVFLSPITNDLLNAKVFEGDAVEIMPINQALGEPDFRLLKPLLIDLKEKIK